MKSVIRDAQAVFWKELQEIRVRQGGDFGQLRKLFFAPTVIGVFLGWRLGPEWLASPWPAVVAAWLPLYFGMGVVCDAFAGEKERHTLETLLATRLSDGGIFFGKAAAMVAYCLTLTASTLLVSGLAANLFHPQRHPAFFSPIALVGGILAFLAAVSLTSAGFFLSLRASSVQQAQQRMATSVMLLWIVPLGLSRALPSAWSESLGKLDGVLVFTGILGVLLLFALTLTLAAVRRFRRGRLLA